MANSSTRNNLFWGAILVILGMLFLLDNFYILDFGYLISTFWPVILIVIGAKIIMDKRRTQRFDDEDNFTSEESTDTREDGSRLSDSNVFGDISIRTDAKNFSGGSVNNVFGDIKLDISDVKLNNQTTKVYVSGIFGDVTVIIPREIVAKIKSSAVAGDLSVLGNKRDGLVPSLQHQDERYNDASEKLYLQVSVVFGSVNIISQ